MTIRLGALIPALVVLVAIAFVCGYGFAALIFPH